MNEHRRHGHATALPDDLFVTPSGVPIPAKMRWRTGPALAASLQAEFHFDLDAAAEKGARLAPRWFGVEEDCLAQPSWLRGWRSEAGITSPPTGPVFFNPPWGSRGVPKWVREQYPEGPPIEGIDEWAPYPGTEAFVRRAWQASRPVRERRPEGEPSGDGLEVVCLLPQSFSSSWVKRYLIAADEIRVGRRYRFVDVDGRQAPCPPGGHMLLIFRPHVPVGGWKSGPRTEWDWRPV